MRGVHKLMLTGLVTAVSVTMALGQGFPGRGGAGRGAADPATLIRNESVKKELKLTDAQLQKVPDAVWEALAKVLDPEQQKRLHQIILQQRGADAFTDSKVMISLKLNDDQKEAIKSALETQQKEMKELTADLKGGGKKGFQGIGEKVRTIRKETMEKITGVLTTAQKKQWNEMIGEEFKMEFGKGFGFGGGGKKGKGKKKKNDTE